MKCPACGCLESVLCYRTTASIYAAQVKRRRKCVKCGTQFETNEKVTKIKPKQPAPRKKKPENAAQLSNIG